MFKLVRNCTLFCIVLFTGISHAMEGRPADEIVATGTEDEIIELLNSGQLNPDRDIMHSGEIGPALYWAAARNHLKVIEWFATNHLCFDCRPFENSPIRAVMVKQNLSAWKYFTILGVMNLTKESDGLAKRFKEGSPPWHYYRGGMRATGNLLYWCSKIEARTRKIEISDTRFGQLCVQKEVESRKIKHHKNADTTKYAKCFIDLDFLKRIRTLQRADRQNLIAEFKKSVDNGGEIDAPEKSLRAAVPLHMLIHAPTDDPTLFNLVRWLVEKKNANVNALNLDGYTPLTLACMRGNRLLVLFLLAHGADPSIGKNPLLATLDPHTQDAIFPIFENILYGLAILAKDRK